MEAFGPSTDQEPAIARLQDHAWTQTSGAVRASHDIGNDNGPTPVEYVLHALAACLTAGVANVAAARGVNLTEVESTVEGDIDLLGILGLSDQVRNGYQGIKVSFKLRGDDPEKLRKVVEQSRRRSAVYDVVTNGVPVTIEVDAG